ncbi:histidine kinase [Sphingobacterium paludis]|uniref:Histidine kinase n=2 Tax=Sphingobacterium paludis TaxID=1476465 RepID=A0A4R7CYK3_9SPHI|nr:histidine kinase [Sphingobacterium paludis]
MRDSFLSNSRKRILLVFSALVLLYLVTYIIDPFSSYWDGYFTRRSTIADILFSFTLCFAYSETSIFISARLNKRIPWTDSPARRFLFESLLIFFSVLLINFIADFIVLLFMDTACWGIWRDVSIEETRGMLQWMVVSVMIAFMIMAVNTGNYLIQNWKNAAVRASELNQLATQAELQSLRLQIDPHFVFNNLSVLAELILEDQQLGYEYAENFSKIYRYMLVNSKRDVIPLEDELRFLNSYIFLIENRFGEGVQFDIDVDPQSLSLYTPPLTLQLLVENALKHNKTNKKDPLLVRIYTTNPDTLVVENTRLPIKKRSDSSGIGIENIKQRFNLLSVRDLQVLQEDSLFKVIIPLLQR